MILVAQMLLIAAIVQSFVSLVVYVKSKDTGGASRALAFSLFAYGSLASSGAMLLVSILHFHLPFIIHVHDPDIALSSGWWACDLEWGCAFWNILLLTVLILGSSFIVSQASAKALLRRCANENLEDLSRKLRAEFSLPREVDLFVVPEAPPDAYSFSALSFSRRPHIRDAVVITQGLLRLLRRDEIETVLSHEMAHVRARDDRYLPFFHTLASLVFFDPVVHVLRRRIARRYEFSADETAAKSTGKPRSLARALLKLCTINSRPQFSTGILGGKRTPLILERIERLLQLAERMEPAAN